MVAAEWISNLSLCPIALEPMVKRSLPFIEYLVEDVAVRSSCRATGGIDYVSSIFYCGFSRSLWTLGLDFRFVSAKACVIDREPMTKIVVIQTLQEAIHMILDL
ncbi:hypothetical protein V6N12_066304 [Hibiscus sabdariffa]|uniref:Uncharacterized protein n=1 Tax=Hibiscus sabdariffa TaxID=183260 RepID=A0ABR2CPQ1_9ROSI